MASAVSPLHGGKGLVHRSDRGGAAAVRGYLLGPALHSYSEPGDLLDYWEKRLLAEHDGVFSAAVVSPDEGRLTLLSDVFGMGPIYHARLGDAVLFATSPRYLGTASQDPDWVAWHCLLASAFIAGDRSLSTGVTRVPAGTALRFGPSGDERVSWLELASLPDGTRSLDAQGIREVEDVFQRTLDRCLALPRERLVLPLSSGHDSRRFLAALLHRRADFHAFTCRVYHDNRDLDARFASQMAKDFRFPHTVVEEPSASRQVECDRIRRMLTDSETIMHSWVPGLMEALPGRPSVFLDGIVGDILGNPGYRVPGLYGSVERDIEIILDASLRHDFDFILAGRGSTAAGLREFVARYLRTFPQRVNLAEFAFIILRQRRATALWSQQLLPPGHVVVCPYLGLDYVRLLLSFVPAHKHATILQRRCLAEFWPDFLRYPGTRDIPPGIAPRSPLPEARAKIACFRQVLAEIRESGGASLLQDLLSRKQRFGLATARVNGRAALRMRSLNPLLELVSRESLRRVCFEPMSQ
jgi:hypothetical protein